MSDKTDNELIAEFMGFKPQKSELGNTYSHPDLMGVYGGVGMKLKYDTSWDWLMPVVEKIESLLDKFRGETIDISRNRCTITGNDNRSLFDLRAKSKIEATYIAVVTFIKWYQNQKS